MLRTAAPRPLPPTRQASLIAAARMNLVVFEVAQAALRLTRYLERSGAEPEPRSVRRRLTTITRRVAEADQAVYVFEQSSAAIRKLVARSSAPSTSTNLSTEEFSA